MILECNKFHFISRIGSFIRWKYEFVCFLSRKIAHEYFLLTSTDPLVSRCVKSERIFYECEIVQSINLVAVNRNSVFLIVFVCDSAQVAKRTKNGSNKYILLF